MIPNVTVLVTCRNSVRTIDKCVESLTKLNYPNYKIMFIDAFSNDGTYEILKKYAEKKKITLMQHKGNPPTAYNFALSHINSDLTAFTNADCVADSMWLRELVKPFEDKSVNASAGIALNPKRTENILQHVIGKELEHRYRNFPQKVSRAPDMNLCLRTRLARSVRFNEKFDVSYDADFGYRFTKKYGEISFSQSAIIYHYHRATWRKFFKQQYTYAKFVPLVYLRHKERMRGDHISTPSMLGNIVNMYLILIALLLSPLSPNFLYVSLALLVLFFASFVLQFRDFIERRYFFYFLSMFFVRTIAWCSGLPIGALHLRT
jgi:glycosyltransferase involved in cell wall biosynthesis